MMSSEFRLVKHGEIAAVVKFPPVACALCVKMHNPNLFSSYVRVDEGGGSEAKWTRYHSFASSLAKFKELQKVPLNVIPEQFDFGSGTRHTPCLNVYSLS